MELNNLKTEAAKLRLSAQEKSAMKARIFGVPAPVAMAPQSSPYFIFSYQFLQARVLAPMMVLLVVFVGAGTAGAAQGSLPGDLLYPVKISVNEAVEVALATTPVAKAEVSAKLAERRVEEAEVLASRGELTPEAGEELAASFDAHADTAATLATEIEAHSPDAAMSLRAKLDSSLLAHGAILATLTEGGAKENQEATGVVAARVLARTENSARTASTMVAAKSAPVANQTSNMMLMVADDTATGSEATGTMSLEGDTVDTPPGTTGDQQAALRAQAGAKEALERARELFKNSKANLTSAMITQVSGEFAAIETQMDLGSTTLMTGHFDEAQDDYTQALRRATRLAVILKAQASIKINIISPILDDMPQAGEQSLDILPL